MQFQIIVMCSTFYIIFIESKCITEMLFKLFSVENIGMTHSKTTIKLISNGCTVKRETPKKLSCCAKNAKNINGFFKLEFKAGIGSLNFGFSR